MKTRLVAVLITALVLALPIAASATWGVTRATLRAAATRLVDAEIAGDGATACGILYAPLTATVDGRTCAQRWDARLARILAAPGGAAGLRADLNAIPTAPIAIQGMYATIALPHPLLNRRSHFYWTANCWMLTR